MANVTSDLRTEVATAVDCKHSVSYKLTPGDEIESQFLLSLHFSLQVNSECLLGYFSFHSLSVKMVVKCDIRT